MLEEDADRSVVDLTDRTELIAGAGHCIFTAHRSVVGDFIPILYHKGNALHVIKSKSLGWFVSE